MTRGLARLPDWGRLVVICLLLSPFGLALSPAFFPDTHDPLAGLSSLGGVIGVAVVTRFQNPDYWQLEPAARRQVRGVRATGSACADPDINAIALHLLRAEVKQERSNRIARPIAFAALVVVPIVAALRDGRWWLLAAIPGCAVGIAWAVQQRNYSPSARLARLEAEVGDGSGPSPDGVA